MKVWVAGCYEFSYDYCGALVGMELKFLIEFLWLVEVMIVSFHSKMWLQVSYAQ